MASLTKCLKENEYFSQPENKPEADSIMRDAESYRKEKFEGNANVKAVDERLDEAEKERKGIVGQVKSKLGGLTKKYDIGTLKSLNHWTVISMFRELIHSGAKLNKIDLQAIIAKQLGVKRADMLKDVDFSMKKFEELFEAAVIREARSIVQGVPDFKTGEMTVKSDMEIYADLKKLYESQPILGTRTPDSMGRQAYSTPVHIAFLVQRLAGIDMKGRSPQVYEPTAGHGALVTAARSGVLNEIDELRLESLSEFEIGALHDTNFKVTNHDGTRAVLDGKIKEKSMDAVVANPPFGSMPSTIIDGMIIKNIDHAIIMDALKAMNDNGRAAFIIGGSNFRDGKMTDSNQIFLNWLCNKYNVLYNIDVSGDTYTKQGTSFPYRIIVINGRKAATEPFRMTPLDEGSYQSAKTADDLLKFFEKEAQDGILVTKRTAPMARPTDSPGPAGPGQPESDTGELPPTPGEPPGEPGGEIPGEPGGTPGGPPPRPVAPDGEQPGGGGGATPGGRRGGVPDDGEPGPGGLPSGETPPGPTPGAPGSEPGDGGAGASGAGTEGGTGGNEPGGPVGHNLEDELQNISSTDLDNMFDDLLGELEGKKTQELSGSTSRAQTPAPEFEYPKEPNNLIPSWKRRPVRGPGRAGSTRSAVRPEPVSTPNVPRTPMETLKASGIEAVEGIKDALDGLATLLGGPSRLSTGLTFDEDTYQKAKPIFQEAWKHAKRAGFLLKEFAKQVLEKYGAAWAPYLKRFIQEMQGGAIFQSPYKPVSRGVIIDETLTPANQAQAIRAALLELESKLGGVDEYVKNQLGYDTIDALYEALSADQIDAVALSIYNMENGHATIIGDQTGVGKGRVAAAMIRYAQKKGKKPIFITEKPTLFTDIYRDLIDIDHADVKPFLMASNKDEAVVKDYRTNETAFTILDSNRRAAMYRDMARRGVEALRDYDCVFTTYSQFQTANPQQKALFELTKGNIVILDESHNASGKSTRGLFTRAMLGHVDGCMYLSATFAKRPDSMPVYYKTAMSMANMTMNDLIITVERGGEPLQEVLSNMLTSVGQYVRREKSFDGIPVTSITHTETRDSDRERAEQMTAVTLRTLAFDVMFGQYVNQVIRPQIDAISAAGGGMFHGTQIHGAAMVPGGRPVTASADHTGFASVVHNAHRQLLFAMKCDIAIEAAAKHFRDGKKVVIGFQNTMESFLKHAIEDETMQIGDSMSDHGFDKILKYHLKKCLDIKIKNPDGSTAVVHFPAAALEGRLISLYNDAIDTINAISVRLPVSPIDYIRQGILKKGISVEEITGRGHHFDVTDDLDDPKLSTRKERPRKEVIRDFNDGKLDVVMLNAAGASGVSLHAGPTYADKRQRVYIGIQAELNVDTEIQKFGRINRKGQVIKPMYELHYLDLPAENRPGAVIQRKMRSLNANTSANSASAIDPKRFPDLNNKYGARVVAAWVAEHPVVATTLNIDHTSPVDRVTGRMSSMPVEVQENFWDEVSAEYELLIEELKELGTYDLEMETVDFQAIQKGSIIMVSGTRPGNPFGESTYMTEYDVVMPKKPFNTARIGGIIAEKLAGKIPKQFTLDFVSDLKRTVENYIQDQAQNNPSHTTEMERRIRATMDNIAWVFQDNYGQARHYIGDTYSLYDVETRTSTTAVLLGLSSYHGKGNPAQYSRIKMEFAVPDGRQKISIPVSKIIGRGVRAGNRVDVRFKTRGIVYNWDDLAQDRRYTRHIITGNLLQGFSQAPDGSKFVRFTTDNGTILDGILTPSSYTPNTRDDTVTINANEAAILFDHDIGLVNHSIPMNIVTQVRSGVKYGVLRVNPSKQAGGIFFNDARLQSLMHKKFETIGSNMEGIFKLENARDIINQIYAIGGTFVVDRRVYRDFILNPQTPTGIAESVNPYFAQPRYEVGELETEVVSASSMRDGFVEQQIDLFGDPIPEKQPKKKAAPKQVAPAPRPPATPAPQTPSAPTPGPTLGEGIFAETPDVQLPQGQWQVYHRIVSGYIKGDPVVVSHYDVAALMKFIVRSGGERFYSVAIDKNNRIIDVQFVSKGGRTAANVNITDAGGHLVNLPDVDRVYYIHQHPGGKAEFSSNDIDLRNQLRDYLHHVGIKVQFMVLARDQWITDDGQTGHIKDSINKVALPITEYAMTTHPALSSLRALRSPDDAKSYLSGIGKLNTDGVLFLNAQNQPVKYLQFDMSKKAKELTRDFISESFSTGAIAVVFNVKDDLIFSIPNDAKANKRLQFFIDMMSFAEEYSILVHDLISAGNAMSVNGGLQKANKKIYPTLKGNQPLYRRRQAFINPDKGLTVQDIQGFVNDITHTWGNAPKIKIVQNESELPAEILSNAVGYRVDGCCYKDTVYMIADNISDLDYAARVLTHEAMGHFGLRSMLGEDFVGMMSTVYNEKSAEINILAKQIGYDTSTRHGRVYAAEEWLCRQAEKEEPSGILDRIIAYIKGLFRKIMPGISFSDTEIRTLLADARYHVKKPFAKRRSPWMVSPHNYQGISTGFLFGGVVGASPGMMKDYSVANQMVKDGYSRQEILGQTGWWRGYDDKWTVELDDSGITWLPIAAQIVDSEDYGSYDLFDVISYPELKSVYGNKLDRITVEFSSSMSPGNGSYDGRTGIITLGGHPPSTKTAWTPAMKTALVHELQHAIQDIEGFQPGTTLKKATRTGPDEEMESLKEDIQKVQGEILDLTMELDLVSSINNKETTAEIEKKIKKFEVYRDALEKRVKDLEWLTAKVAYDWYLSDAGEAMARLVSYRRQMQPEERYAVPPWVSMKQMLMSEGLLKEGQMPEAVLIHSVGGGTAMSVEQPTAIFLGWQENVGGKPPVALYNVKGGPLDKSTATADTLAKAGIPIPEAIPFIDRFGDMDPDTKKEHILDAQNQISESVDIKNTRFFKEWEQREEHPPGFMATKKDPQKEVIDELIKRLMKAQTKDNPQVDEARKAFKKPFKEILKESGSIFDLYNNNLGKGYKDTDMKWYQRAFAYELPMWQGERYASMKRATEIELRAAERRSKELLGYYKGSLGDIQENLPKNKKDYNDLRSLIWKWDGTRFPKSEVPTDWYEVSEDGSTIVHEAHYDEVAAYLEDQGYNDDVIEAFVTIRKTLDRAFVDAEATMMSEKVDPTLIEEFRSSIHLIHNYFPHRRAGDSKVTVLDKNGKAIYVEHYNSLNKLKNRPPQVIERAKQWLQEEIDAGRRAPEDEDNTYSIVLGKVKQLPHSVFFQVPVEQMQQIAAEAGRKLEQYRVEAEARRLKGQSDITMDEAMRKARAKLTADMENALSYAMAEVFKAAGWGKHAIKRKDIPGHETEDVFGILFDYLSGYVGFKTKITRAREHHHNIITLSPNRGISFAAERPNEYEVLIKYVKDMLENSDAVDRAVDAVRGMFFVKYLGFVVKSGIVNLTQNYAMAAPVLSQYMEKGGVLEAERRITKAMFDTRRALTSKAAWLGKEISYPGLSANESRALHDLNEEGVTIDSQLRELKGNLPGLGWGKYFKKFVDVSGIFMQLAERFNRTSTGLAAYRLAVEQGHEHADAVEFAKKAIYQSHFVYGKINLPGAVRGSTAGKYIRSAYTFRSFTHNYLSAVSHLLRNQKYGAVARSMRNILIMGGLTSIPFFKVFAEALTWALGDDDEEPMTKIRGMLPESLWLRDLVTFGLPGLLGYDVSGSLSIEMPRNWKDILGVPYAVIEDTQHMYDSWTSGQRFRAMAESPFTPIAIRNAERSLELLFEGQLTRAGGAIAAPGESEPAKISIAEALGKGVLGFQPTAVSRGYKSYEAVTRTVESTQQKATKWANRAVNAFRDGDEAELDKIIDEVSKWNMQAVDDGKPERMVDLKGLIKSRMKPAGAFIPKKARPRAVEISEEWNLRQTVKRSKGE